jgi:hypothetical protein
LTIEYHGSEAKHVAALKSFAGSDRAAAISAWMREWVTALF